MEFQLEVPNWNYWNQTLPRTALLLPPIWIIIFLFLGEFQTQGHSSSIKSHTLKSSKLNFLRAAKSNSIVLSVPVFGCDYANLRVNCLFYSPSSQYRLPSEPFPQSRSTSTGLTTCQFWNLNFLLRNRKSFLFFLICHPKLHWYVTSCIYCNSRIGPNGQRLD